MRSFTSNWFVRSICVGALGAAAWGCSVEAAVDVPSTRPPPSSPTGTLTQRWSIGGRFDRRYCAAYGADRMQLVIRDVSGRIAATAFQPCEELQMSVRLVTGSYTADAWLIASDGTRISTTLALDPFQIARNTETFIDTDFPTSSLLTSALLRGYGALEAIEEALGPNDEAVESSSDRLESSPDAAVELDSGEGTDEENP